MRWLPPVPVLAADVTRLRHIRLMVNQVCPVDDVPCLAKSRLLLMITKYSVEASEHPFAFSIMPSWITNSTRNAKKGFPNSISQGFPFGLQHLQRFILLRSFLIPFQQLLQGDALQDVYLLEDSS